MAGERVTTEGRIIGEFLAPLAAGFPGAFGLQDDCAVAAPSAGHEFVLKTDAIAEGVHYLASDPAADVGWKALAVNVSDLAAKGARPVAYLMSLAFPEAPLRSWLADFARGLAEAQAAFGISLIGGDTDRRPGPVSITPMVIGEVPVGAMVRQAAAQAGDVVMVSGTLGDAALGLRLRTDPGLAARWRLPPAGAAALEARYLRPQPRLALREALRAHARAAMDLSDGVVKDLGRMCRASGVAARIDLERLPVSDAFRAVQAADPEAALAALVAGDDYEVLVTAPPDRAAALGAAAAAAGVPVAVVGQITAGAGLEVVDASGRDMALGTTGWDHF